jgi:uncharacterized protein YheU (UPF0270 family)
MSISYVIFVDGADSITIFSSTASVGSNKIENIIESAILSIPFDYKVIWRIRGEIEANKTFYKFSIQQGRTVLSWKELTDVLYTLKMNLTELSAADLEYSIYMKPIAYATLSQVQYAPGYAFCALAFFGLIAVSWIISKKSILQYKRPFDKALTKGFIFNLFAWSLVLFVFAEEPTTTSCRLRLLYPLLLVSFEIG